MRGGHDPAAHPSDLRKVPSRDISSKFAYADVLRRDLVDGRSGAQLLDDASGTG